MLCQAWKGARDSHEQHSGKRASEAAEAGLRPDRSQKSGAGENSAERGEERGPDSEGAEENQGHDIPASARVKGQRIH